MRHPAQPPLDHPHIGRHRARPRPTPVDWLASFGVFATVGVCVGVLALCVAVLVAAFMGKGLL